METTHHGTQADLEEMAAGTIQEMIHRTMMTEEEEEAEEITAHSGAAPTHQIAEEVNGTILTIQVSMLQFGCQTTRVAMRIRLTEPPPY